MDYQRHWYVCRDKKTAIAVLLIFNCSFFPTHIPVPHIWIVRGKICNCSSPTLQLQFFPYTHTSASYIDGQRHWHCMSCTAHTTQYTRSLWRVTFCTSHTALHTVNCKLGQCEIHCIPCTAQTAHTLLHTLHTLHCTHFTAHTALHTLQATHCNKHCTAD